MPLDMLKNIELSTGSVSNRKIGDIDFSIQFTDNTANISLSNAPWNGKFDKTNFYVRLQYIFEQSKTLNDPFPSLIRLFREDIREDKDKLMAFAVLMKKLDTALTGECWGRTICGGSSFVRRIISNYIRWSSIEV